MGKKWGIQFIQAATFFLILSLIITNSMKSAQAQTNESIKEEQILIIKTSRSIEGQILDRSISPFNSSYRQEWAHVINLVGASLYQKYAPLSNGKHDYFPQLAAGDPESSEDGLTFIVKLRSNLKFSNGKPLTAKDVVFSYNLYLTPGINNVDYDQVSSIFAFNSSIVDIDDLTIQFNFAKSTVYNFETLTQKPIIEKSPDNEAKYNNCLMGIVKDCDWSNSDGTFMVGAGPYMIDSQNFENQEIELVKNPYYHDKQVWADRLIVKAGFEHNAIKEAVNEDADVIYMGTNYDLFATLSENTPYKLFPWPHAMVATIDLNNIHPIFGTGEEILDGDNAVSSNNLVQANYVRRAISYAMDRDYMGLEVWGGAGSPASAPISPLAVGFNTSIIPHEFSLDLAMQYLESAGFDYDDIIDANGDGDYSDENDTRFFDFTVSTHTDLDSELYLNHSAIQLSKIGIGLEIDVHPTYDTILPRTFLWANSTLVPIYDEGGFDAAMWYYSFDQPYSTFFLYTSSGLCNSNIENYRCNNYGNYINAEYDALVAEFETEGSEWLRRQELLGQMQQILYDDLPSIAISYPDSPIPVKKDVTMPDGKYFDSGIILWEFAKKDGWKDPASDKENQDNPIGDFPNVEIVIVIVVVIAGSTFIITKRR